MSNGEEYDGLDIMADILAAEIEASFTPEGYMGGEYLQSEGPAYARFDKRDMPTLGIEYDEAMDTVYVEIQLPPDTFIGVVTDGVMAVLSADPAIELTSAQFFSAVDRLKKKESETWQ